MEQFDIVVVGAGGSGLIAASRAAEKGASVLLLEKMDRPGKKLLITGKGRCNITNTANFDEYFKHIRPRGRFLKNAFSRFFNDDIVALLRNNGVKTSEERGGRIFPVDNRSKEVVEALYGHARSQDVEFRFGCPVIKILTDEHNQVTGVEISQGSQPVKIGAEKVILCTGGKSYPATGSEGDGYMLAQALGHSIKEPRPSLVPLVTSEVIDQHAIGLTLKNINATLWINGKKQTEQFGEMFFVPYGLSGPVILTLSRQVVDEVKNGNRVEISIDLKPALDEKKLDNRLLRDINNNGKKQMISLFKMWLPSDLIPLFIKETSIEPSREASQITSKERTKIKMLMKALNFTIKGPRSFKEAIITAGGIPTGEINSKTMESKLVSNLYFAGEVIDVDGDTGGYNLQIAWSTGWLAGESAANEVKNEESA